MGFCHLQSKDFSPSSSDEPPLPPKCFIRIKHTNILSPNKYHFSSQSFSFVNILTNSSISFVFEKKTSLDSSLIPMVLANLPIRNKRHIQATHRESQWRNQVLHQGQNSTRHVFQNPKPSTAGTGEVIEPAAERQQLHPLNSLICLPQLWKGPRASTLAAWRSTPFPHIIP